MAMTMNVAMIPMLVDVVITGNVVHEAMIGSGSAVNIMSYHTMKALRLELTGPSTHSLKFHSGSECIPAGVIKNVPVDVGRVRILTTFHVLPPPDANPKTSYCLLLGRPWMSAANASIGRDKEWGFVVKISRGNETITIPHRKTASAEQGISFTSPVDIGTPLTK